MWGKYKAIFFDWDGTAVVSRKAPVNEVVTVMAPLLEKGIKLVIVSGTTMENIADGKIERWFTNKQLDNLYLGLGRGAYNYAFQNGHHYLFSNLIPDLIMLENIHRTCFDIHMKLKHYFDYDTDIVFSRPNYCKIDLMVDSDRKDQLFMQENELSQLEGNLSSHGIKNGLQGLMSMARESGDRYGIKIIPTCDAKYLEVGISSKSDNVDMIMEYLAREYGILPNECSFWGDEYVNLAPEIYGSDSFMYTDKTKRGDFFDVSEIQGNRPQCIQVLGGGVQTFLKFLKEEGDIR